MALSFDFGCLGFLGVFAFLSTWILRASVGTTILAPPQSLRLCYYASVGPNYLEQPNISNQPNEESIDRVIGAYERFHAWITKLHVPHFLEVSLTLAQLKTLYLVAYAGPLRMSEVAERLGTAPSTTTGVVEGLVQLELIERVVDPADRRQVHVRATAKAHETLEDFHDLSRTRLRELLEQVPSESDLIAIQRAVDLLADAAGRAAEGTNE